MEICFGNFILAAHGIPKLNPIKIFLAKTSEESVVAVSAAARVIHGSEVFKHHASDEFLLDQF